MSTFDMCITDGPLSTGPPTDSSVEICASKPPPFGTFSSVVNPFIGEAFDLKQYSRACKVSMWYEKLRTICGDDVIDVQSILSPGQMSLVLLAHRYIAYVRNNVPASRLVGIELNPGPTKKNKKTKIAKFEKKLGKLIVNNVPRVRGRGVSNTNKRPPISGLGSGRDAFKRLTGNGDYSVRDNVLNGAYSSGGMPAVWDAHRNNPLAMSHMNPADFMSSKDATIICHSDYIGPAYGSSSFSLSQYPLVSTNTTTFPWLSSVADSFQQYQLLGCIFEYVSHSSNYSAASALGDVIFSTEYNPTVLSPTTLAAAYNNEYTTYSSPDKSFVHGIELNPSKTVVPLKFTSPGTGQDIDFSSYGNTNFITGGNPSTGIIGELFVHYMVKLIKPQLPNLLGTTSALTYGSCVGHVNSSPLGNALVYLDGVDPLNYGVTFSVVGSTSLQVNVANPGTYMVLVSCQINAAISFITTPSPSASSVGVTSVNMLPGYPGGVANASWFNTCNSVSDWQDSSGATHSSYGTTIAFYFATPTAGNVSFFFGNLTYLGSTPPVFNATVSKIPTGVSNSSLAVTDELTLLRDQVNALSQRMLSLPAITSSSSSSTSYVMVEEDSVNRQKIVSGVSTMVNVPSVVVSSPSYLINRKSVGA